MAVSNMFDAGKNIQFGIMVFLEVQEINLQSNMQGSKWRSLRARWPIILESVSQQQHILYNNFLNIITFRA